MKARHHHMKVVFYCPRIARTDIGRTWTQLKWFKIARYPYTDIAALLYDAEIIEGGKYQPQQGSNETIFHLLSTPSDTATQAPIYLQLPGPAQGEERGLYYLVHITIYDTNAIKLSSKGNKPAFLCMIHTDGWTSVWPSTLRHVSPSKSYACATTQRITPFLWMSWHRNATTSCCRHGQQEIQVQSILVCVLVLSNYLPVNDPPPCCNRERAPGCCCGCVQQRTTISGVTWRLASHAHSCSDRDMWRGAASRHQINGTRTAVSWSKKSFHIHVHD